MIKINLPKNLKGAIFKKARGVKILCLSSMAGVLILLGGVMPTMAQSPVYSTNGGSSAQNEVRLQQMETQIRELTGRVESQIYEINQLKQQIKKLEAAEFMAKNPVNDTPKTNELPRVNVPPPAAGQIGVPVREKPQTLHGESLMAAPTQRNPLNLDLKALEPQGMKTALPGGRDATASYERAFANLKAEKYDEAQTGFENFLTDHGDHVLAANAKYWLGETHYVRGQYKTAARVFAEGFQAFPKSAKAPDMLLKLGMSLNGMDKKKEACVALSQVSVKFPTGSDPVVQRAAKEMEKLGCES